jgi:hypothetical protein
MRLTWRKAITYLLVAGVGLALPASALAAKRKSPKSRGTAAPAKDVTATKDGKVLSDTARGVKSADTTFDGRKHVEPVKGKQTARRTPQQAIIDYKASGENPRLKPKRIDVPPPATSNSTKPAPVARKSASTPSKSTTTKSDKR